MTLKKAEILDHIWRTVDKLKTLEPGWDSYDGKTPDKGALDIGEAIATLFNRKRELINSSTIFEFGIPYFVPCPDGSVQIEYHENGYDIEIWIGKAPTDK